MTKRVIAFVPVKLHSRRIPRKNKELIAGKPLCWHVCNALAHVNRIDEVCVYCSDEDVLDLVPEGTRFIKRPKWLDGDLVQGLQIYNEFVSEMDADIYVLAHTTSPFLTVKTIEEGLSAVLDRGYDSAFTVERAQTFSWYEGKPINYDPKNIPRTQDIEPVWIETSGYYIFEKEVFTEKQRRIGDRPFMVEVSHLEALDIDEPEDLEFARMVANWEKR